MQESPRPYVKLQCYRTELVNNDGHILTIKAPTLSRFESLMITADRRISKAKAYHRSVLYGRPNDLQHRFPERRKACVRPKHRVSWLSQFAYTLQVEVPNSRDRTSSMPKLYVVAMLLINAFVLAVSIMQRSDASKRTAAHLKTSRDYPVDFHWSADLRNFTSFKMSSLAKDHSSVPRDVDVVNYRFTNSFNFIHKPLPTADVLVSGFGIKESEEDDEHTTNDDDNGATEPRSKEEAPPATAFSVKIGNDSFYGGLLTYSHEQHPARVCRVMNACVRPDGTLVLPKWMQRHDNTLSFQCGQSKLEFSLPDTSPPEHIQPIDLIGTECPRPSMPDFLRDFMPNAVIFDLVYGDHHVSKTCHSRKGKDCDAFPGLSQNFRPAVLLHPRLEELDEKKSWVRQFVKLMKPKNAGMQAKVLYTIGAGDGSNDMQCFRTAFFTRGPYNGNLIMKDHLRDMHFFAPNDIAKKARKVSQVPSTDSDEVTSCKLNITISNRKLIDGARSRLIGRYIMNIPQLRKAIRKQARRIPGLRARVATLTLEGRSLRWQINAMQKSDIWIAGHGSLLTNMLFLRENSTIMEIQPFAYYPTSYEKMAKHLAHVNYDRYIAHPDVEAFKTCMTHMYPKSHRSHRKAIDMIQKFTKAAAKYKQSDSTHSLVLSRFNETALRHVKMCTQMQRLDTSAKNLAIAVVRHARLRCELPKPELKSSEA